MTPTIGVETVYIGTELPELRDQRVNICAILHDALLMDGDAHYYVLSETVLQWMGGVTARDRVEVVRVRDDNTPGILHFAPRAVDLAHFAHLASEAERLPPTERNPIPDEAQLALLVRPS